MIDFAETLTKNQKERFAKMTEWVCKLGFDATTSIDKMLDILENTDYHYFKYEGYGD